MIYVVFAPWDRLIDPSGYLVLLILISKVTENRYILKGKRFIMNNENNFNDKNSKIKI